MNTLFAETLKKLRKEKGLTQLMLATRIFVNPSSVAHWENGSRLPDAAMITRLAKVLDVDVSMLFSTATESNASPVIIIVDDDNAILIDSLLVLEEVIPNATVTGFDQPHKAVEYAKMNRVNLAILDIELGTASGLDFCHTLLEINPCTNVVYLTAFPDHALRAWDTCACGFMLKPLTMENVQMQLKKLRYPFSMRGTDE